jgi:DNA-binding transcriptional ArsR family regulator
VGVNALDAIGNPVRRALLERLRPGPQSVQQLADNFDISRPAVSRHLRVLEDAGLVTHAAHGRQNLYALRAEGFAEVRGYLDALWGDALARFTLVADNLTDDGEST